MIKLLGFSPSRLALGSIGLSMVALVLLSVPLWYAWRTNIATFKAYVLGEDVQGLADVFDREGARGLAATIDSRVATLPSDEIMILADVARMRLASNLPAWPVEVPDAPGTYGLVIGLGGGASMRVVASQVILPGGYRLLVGRESIRFQSLVELFWYGIAGAVTIVLVLGTGIGWLIHRALLSEADAISRTVSAIAAGDLSRRLAASSGSPEFDTLARTVNAMLARLARQNKQLEAEVAVRREAERAHQRAQDELEGVVAERTGELARANALLRESEQRFTLALAGSIEGIFDWDLATDLVFMSPRAQELFEMAPGGPLRPRDEWLAMIRYHPDDVGPLRQVICAHISGETPACDIEFRAMLPDGYRWFRQRGAALRDASGKAYRMAGSIEDVTERKLAADALRLSEERYALAMKASGVGHWDWKIASDEFYASPQWREIVGFPPDEELPGRSEVLARFPFHPEDRPKYEAAVAAHFAGATPRVDIELRITPRGELRWVRFVGVCSRNPSGTPLRWAGSAIDVTDRKRVEEELRARQEMLDLAQKAARATAFEWQVGAGEGENRWSPDLEAMYGLAPGSYDGTYEAWRKLVFPEDWPAVEAAIKRAGETGDVAAEYRVVHPGGAIRWLQAKGRMFFPDGKPTRVVGFMLDVTDRHLAHEELQRMERELRQAQRLEAMGTLAGGIAHDFNNLLGAILGYGEMALRDVPADTRLRRDVESIMIAGERGRALVDRVLAFSRSGVGERVAVHVEEVVRETLALFTAKLPRGIVVEQLLYAGGATVMGDPTQIHQVLMNLLINAVHAMASNGTDRKSVV